jgi:hypothetical protein
LDINRIKMADIFTKKEAIDEIVKEAKKLDKIELQILLTKLRVKKMLKDGVKPAARYNSKKVKPPTMAQIDKWKHESRKQYAQ